MFTPPSPPTDNLYKFMAVSGIVFLLASGLILYQSSIPLSQEFDQLSAEQRSLNLLSEMYISRFNRTLEASRKTDAALEKAERLREGLDKAESLVYKRTSDVEEKFNARINLIDQKFRQTIKGPIVDVAGARRLLAEREKATDEYVQAGQQIISDYKATNSEFQQETSHAVQESDRVNDLFQQLGEIQWKMSTQLNEVLAGADQVHTKYRAFVISMVGAALFMIIGILATVHGFRLWYHRVQRPLDLILQRQCAPESEATAGGPTEGQQADRG